MRFIFKCFNTFTGIGAEIEIGADGDRIPYYLIYQFLGEDGKATLIAQSSDRNTVRINLYSEVKTIQSVWRTALHA